MSIKIIGHPSLVSDLYVKMSQVIQEIDMLSQFVKREMRKWGIFREIFQPRVRTGPEPGPLSAILIQNLMIKKKKFTGKLSRLEANPQKP